MSNVVKSYLKTNPVLTKYIQMGFVNINALARHIKTNNSEISSKSTIASIGMDIRRQIAKLPRSYGSKSLSIDQQLHIVTRANLQELIFDKIGKNRQICLDLFNRISKTKHFSCLVEGEKEMVLLTDFSLDKISNVKSPKKTVSHQTSGLGFISIDFSIGLREVVGVYSYITTSLSLANIPIHSFHTIGGEILILVRNEDLIKAQEVLISSLKIMS